MPRVLLDATALPQDRGGVGRYVDELVAALDDAGADLVVVCQQRDGDRFVGLAPRTEVVPASERIARRPVRLVWEQTALPALAKRLRAEVVHSPHYTLPLASPVPVVVTLHDATFFSDPDVHLARKARFFRTATRVAVRRAAVCVVPSAATRDEVLRFTGEKGTPFVVAYHGVDTSVFRPPSDEAVARLRDVHQLGDRAYVGFLGTLEPRKNIATLVRAFADATSDMPSRPLLLLAGSKGWDSDIETAVQEVSGTADVRALGYLPYDDLPVFLGGAEVIAYPSLGEGFGLPVLEAMASGAAVLTTRALALPEVGGDAVAYAGTTRSDLAAALRDLLDDEPRRLALRSMAVERAAGFTWAASAEQHMRAYETAASNRR